jgi:hypothetical protein
MADSAGRRRSTGIAAAVAVLVGLGLTAVSADRATVTDVLSIPPEATVVADRLGNGTPVFVVHSPGGPDGAPLVDVIQAFTTEVDGPVTELVGWCGRAQLFVAGHHGPLYDVRGRRLASAVSGRLPAAVTLQGRTALDDLIHRRSSAIADRLAEGQPLRVDGIQPLQPWQGPDRPPPGNRVPPDACRLPAPVGASDEPAAAPRVIHHGFLAGRLDPGAAGWQITDGWLHVSADGTASWCDDEPVGTTCEAPRPDVVVDLGLTAADVGADTVLGGPLAVRMGDGAVQRVAVLPTSTWVGSSLRGTRTHGGVLTGAPAADRPELRLLAVGYDDGCPRTWVSTTSAGGRVTRVPLDPAVHVDVDGVTDPEALVDGVRDVGVDVAVEVVVDAVTCRALAVTDRP